jgi:hypothetical protein
MAMGGQHHSSAASHPEKINVTHFTAGWVGPRASLNACGKPRCHRDSITGPSSPQPVAVAIHTLLHVKVAAPPSYVHMISTAPSEEGQNLKTKSMNAAFGNSLSISKCYINTNMINYKKRHFFDRDKFACLVNIRQAEY